MNMKTVCMRRRRIGLKGELLLRRDDSNAAEAQICFERAIEIARKQSAKSWELRATMSLARLLRDISRPRRPMICAKCHSDNLATAGGHRRVMDRYPKDGDAQRLRALAPRAM